MDGLTPPPAWMDRAPCKGQLDVMFDGDKADGTDEAKAICAACPYAEPCLRFAVEHGMIFGVWGGVGPATRRKMRRGTLRPPRKVAECGTVGGYARHRETLMEQPCDPCREAWNAYRRQRRAETRKAASAA